MDQRLKTTPYGSNHDTDMIPDANDVDDPPGRLPLSAWPQESKPHSP